MFSAFGSILNDDMENGLMENFATNKKSKCLMVDGTSYCPENNTTTTSSDSEGDGDGEGGGGDDDPEQTSAPTTGIATTSTTEENEEISSDEEEEAAEEEEENEGFRGSRKEHFTNHNEVAKKALSMNLFLKAVLFTCLFYILAHNDTRDFIIKKVFKSAKAVKSKHYLYIAMVLFFIVFYILSVFL